MEMIMMCLPLRFFVVSSLGFLHVSTARDILSVMAKFKMSYIYFTTLRLSGMIEKCQCCHSSSLRSVMKNNT
jgi:hypothetical protein